VFLSLDSFRSPGSRDGFCRQDNILHARVGGVEMQFGPEPERNRAVLRGAGFILEVQWEPFEVMQGRATDSESVTLDTALLRRMKTVWESIFNSGKPNMVNPDPLAGRAGSSVEEKLSTRNTI
ncbi:MAG: hypothetical protein AAB382_02260, partial [Chloroflexota bacterium]